MPPPHSCCPLAVIQKGLFSASVRAAQLGREGGKKEDRRASRQWWEARGRTRALSTAVERRQERTQPVASCGAKPSLRSSSPFPTSGGTWVISRTSFPPPGQFPCWAEHKTQKLRPLPALFRSLP